MINEKHMSIQFYWDEAACTTVYLMNWCTTSGMHECTPHEKYYGRKPNLSHSKVFGSIAFVQKLDPKSEKYILMGYSLEQKGHKCFNPSIWKVRISWGVVFENSASWYEPDSAPSEPIEEDLDTNSEVDIQPRLTTRESLSSTMMSAPQ